MASADSTSLAPIMTNLTYSKPPLNQLLNQVTTIKLERGNYLLWRNLALPVLKSYGIKGHLTGETQCQEKSIRPASASSEAAETGTGTLSLEKQVSEASISA